MVLVLSCLDTISITAQQTRTQNIGSDYFTALTVQTVDFRIVTKLDAEIRSTESKCVEWQIG
jgi:hypothetical protein